MRFGSPLTHPEWRPFFGEIPPTGRVEITADSEGSGTLIFHNSKPTAARMPVGFADGSALGHALEICEMGDQGRPLHSDLTALESRHSAAVLSVVKDHPLAALRCLEALHSGDHAFFRNLADVIRNRHAAPKIDESRQLSWAIVRACCGMAIVPTVEAVAEQWEHITGYRLPRREMPRQSDKPQARPATSPRLERFKARLVDAGWGWLPSRKRGDTLRRDPQITVQ